MRNFKERLMIKNWQKMFDKCTQLSADWTEIRTQGRIQDELEHQKDAMVKVCKCFIIKQFHVQDVCQEGYLSVSQDKEFLLEVPPLAHP